MAMLNNQRVYRMLMGFNGIDWDVDGALTDV